MHTYRLRRQRVLDSIDSLDLPAEPKMAVRELLVSNIAFMDGFSPAPSRWKGSNPSHGA
jgi:hypothetical protein